MPPKKKPRAKEVDAFENTMHLQYRYRYSQELGLLFHRSELTNDNIIAILNYLKDERNFKNTINYFFSQQ